MSLKPPLILSSANIDNNTSIDYKTNVVFTNSLSDNYATLSEGYLKNLNDPINSNQAATKHFVDNFVGIAEPSGPIESIQINNSNTFVGTNNLTFNSITGITNLNGIFTNGTITLSNNILTGLSQPINPQDAANKAYVDSKNNQLTDNVESLSYYNIQDGLFLTFSDLNNKNFINEFYLNV